MKTARPDRIWVYGGPLAAAILLAVAWFFLIGPQNDEAQNLQDQAAAATARLATIQHHLVELRKENGKLEEYRAQLAHYREALPTTSGLSDFLRELQTAGLTAGVAVDGILVGAPAQVAGVAQPVYSVPVTLITVGSIDKLEAFLDQLQQLQPRAVLINSVNAVPEGQSPSLAGSVSITISLQIFVTGPATPATPADPGASGNPATAGSAPKTD